MNIFQFFAHAVVLTVVLASVPIGAVAQANVTVNGQDNPDEVIVCPNDATCIESKEYDSSEGVLRVTISSELSQTMSHVDYQQGTSNMQSDRPVVLDPTDVQVDSGRTTIEIPAESNNGRVMVGLTSEFGQTVILRAGSHQAVTLPGTPTQFDWVTALGSAFLSAISIVGTCAWWFKRGSGGVYELF